MVAKASASWGVVVVSRELVNDNYTFPSATITLPDSWLIDLRPQGPADTLTFGVLRRSEQGVGEKRRSIRPQEARS